MPLDGRTAVRDDEELDQLILGANGRGYAPFQFIYEGRDCGSLVPEIMQGCWIIIVRPDMG